MPACRKPPPIATAEAVGLSFSSFSPLASAAASKTASAQTPAGPGRKTRQLRAGALTPLRRRRILRRTAALHGLALVPFLRSMGRLALGLGQRALLNLPLCWR